MPEEKKDLYPVLFSIKQVSVLLGLGSTKIYQLIKSGEIVALKSGRKTLISSEAMQNFIKNLKKFS